MKQPIERYLALNNSYQGNIQRLQNSIECNWARCAQEYSPIKPSQVTRIPDGVPHMGKMCYVTRAVPQQCSRGRWSWTITAHIIVRGGAILNDTIATWNTQPALLKKNVEPRKKSRPVGQSSRTISTRSSRSPGA